MKDEQGQQDAGDPQGSNPAEPPEGAGQDGNPNPDQGPEPGQDPESAPRGDDPAAKARREAKNLRERLRETEAKLAEMTATSTDSVEQLRKDLAKATRDLDIRDVSDETGVPVEVLNMIGGFDGREDLASKAVKIATVFKATTAPLPPAVGGRPSAPPTATGGGVDTSPTGSPLDLARAVREGVRKSRGF